MGYGCFADAVISFAMNYIKVIALKDGKTNGMLKILTYTNICNIM